MTAVASNEVLPEWDGCEQKSGWTAGFPSSTGTAPACWTVVDKGGQGCEVEVGKVKLGQSARRRL